MNRAIIFDSGTLITFTMNGLLPELREMKKIFKGHFVVTEDVKREIIDKPLTIKRFELEAVKLQKLIDDKVIEMPSVFGINKEDLYIRTQEIKEIANSTFVGRGKEIHIIDSGEASCLALSKMLDEQKVKNVIAIDERTTRMLSEKPENLENLLRKKLHTKISFDKKNFAYFKGFRFIRSCELLYVAYKKGVVRWKGENVLDALLWAAKFKGCSVSGDEINEIKGLR